jgi:hypothetical protein
MIGARQKIALSLLFECKRDVLDSGSRQIVRAQARAPCAIRGQAKRHRPFAAPAPV